MRCFHCLKQNGTLIRLELAPNLKKIVCLDCLWARHPKSAIDIMEFILDKEQQESAKLKLNIDIRNGHCNEGGIYGETIY
jgi:hypothetical protein